LGFALGERPFNKEGRGRLENPFRKEKEIEEGHGKKILMAISSEKVSKRKKDSASITSRDI
jgi:hypothetical protein